MCNTQRGAGRITEIINNSKHQPWTTKEKAFCWPLMAILKNKDQVPSLQHYLECKSPSKFKIVNEYKIYALGNKSNIIEEMTETFIYIEGKGSYHHF